jgi:predicted ATPase
LTTFIGRRKEVRVIKQEVGSRRLITLTGPGGIGKTRLSLQVGADLVNDFQHGVWFVELDHVTDPLSVATTITHIFNIHETGGRNSEDVLKDYLREKKLLLILDNFEQVIEAATLVKELLMVARGLKIIVTSRVPLRVSGEYEYHVPLLPLPSQEKPLTLERLAELESIQLFVERAQSVKADFILTNENAPAIAEICLRLDGLPLAIELAAARVRVLPPQKMLGQLDKRLSFLTSSSPDLPVRQQTLRAAISWSCDLLTLPEKLLFRRLAVFMRGATLEAIEAVCNIDNELDVLNELESLLEKSLIRQIDQGDDVRYEMLETIRDFADETLVASGEANLLQEQHLLYFHQLATMAESNLVGPNELQWFIRLTEEIDNLRSAVVWGVEQDLEKAVELIYKLTLFWSRGGHNDQVIGWLDLALSKPLLNVQDHAPLQSLNVRGKALLTLGILSIQQGYSQAEAVLHESIVLLRQLEEKGELAVALAFVGYLGDLEASRESVDIARSIHDKWIQSYCLAWQSQALRLAGGDLHLARRSAEESAELAREIKSPWAVARSSFSQGQLDVALGELAQARTYFEECLTLFSRSQDKYHANMARSELAYIERRQGNNPEALKLYQASILDWSELGLQSAVARQLEGLAMIVATQGSLEEAVHLFGAAMNLRDQTGSQLMPEEQIKCDNIFEGVRKQVEEKVFKEWLLEGKDMEMSEAVIYALSLPNIA